MRRQKWSASNLSAALAGKDPMAAIGDLVAGYWARQYQKELINILAGVFASTSMKDHILDISALEGKLPTFLPLRSSIPSSSWAMHRISFPLW